MVTVVLLSLQISHARRAVLFLLVVDSTFELLECLRLSLAESGIRKSEKDGSRNDVLAEVEGMMLCELSTPALNLQLRKYKEVESVP